MQCIGAILCAVAVLHWAGPSVGANSAPEVHLGNQQDRQIIEKELEAQSAVENDASAFRDVVPAVTPIENDPQLPFLPMIATGGISLSFTDVTLAGLSDLNIEVRGDVKRITAPRFSLISGRYIAGGKVKNLPFVGESTANLTIVDFSLDVSFTQQNSSRCWELGSTAYIFGIRSLKVQFDDLNPGTESGDLVNTMLSGMGPDVAALLTAAFNGDLHEMVDTLVVNSVNSYLRCDTIADNGEPIFGTDLVDMIDFSGLFEKFYGMFSDVYIKR